MTNRHLFKGWEEIKSCLLREKPSLGLLNLRKHGHLRRILPEVESLFGVPQEKKYHPEIDAGVHIMLVVDRAARLSKNLHVRLAALLHDVGKGVTSPEHLPSHPNHEKRGVPLLFQLFERISIPKGYFNFCVMVTKYHGHVHRYDAISPNVRIQFLKELRSHFKEEDIRDFLLACRADYQGRPGYETLDMPYEKRVLKDFRRLEECV